MKRKYQPKDMIIYHGNRYTFICYVISFEINTYISKNISIDNYSYEYSKYEDFHENSPLGQFSELIKSNCELEEFYSYVNNYISSLIFK